MKISLLLKVAPVLQRGLPHQGSALLRARVGEDRVGAVEVLAEEAHAEQEDLAGETSPRLIGADGQLRVPARLPEGKI